MTASQLQQSLALPLFAGGLFAISTGLRAFVSRHLLIEDLATERGAFSIREVYRFALRSTSPENRRLSAERIRGVLDASGGNVQRVEANRARLEELAAALLDEQLAFDPDSAVALDRLSVAGCERLYSPGAPAEDVRSRLLQILGGFHETRTA